MYAAKRQINLNVRGFEGTFRTCNDKYKLWWSRNKNANDVNCPMCETKLKKDSVRKHLLSCSTLLEEYAGGNKDIRQQLVDLFLKSNQHYRIQTIVAPPAASKSAQDEEEKEHGRIQDVIKMKKEGRTYHYHCLLDDDTLKWISGPELNKTKGGQKWIKRMYRDRTSDKSKVSSVLIKKITLTNM
jgi:hypothetical protein